MVFHPRACPIHPVVLRPWVAVCLLAVVGLLASPVSHAQGRPGVPLRLPHHVGPESQTWWVHVGTGWLTDTQLFFQDDQGNFPGIEELNPQAHAMGPVLEFGLQYRVSRIDFGLSVGHISGAQVTFFERQRRLLGQVRVGLDVRWRALDRSWGAFYLRSRIAWSGFRQSDGVRASLAQAFVDEPDVAAVSEHVDGMMTSGALGILRYINPRVGVFLEIEAVAGRYPMRVAGQRVELLQTRGILGLGVQWRL